MKLRYKILILIALVILLVPLYIHGHGIIAGQSTLHVYPVTIQPDGNGTAALYGEINSVQISNAVHITDKDFSEHPALAEVFTGQRSILRTFSKTGGVGPAEADLSGRSILCQNTMARTMLCW
jgi:hypothetical protein